MSTYLSPIEELEYAFSEHPLVTLSLTSCDKVPALHGNDADNEATSPVLGFFLLCWHSGSDD